MRRRFYVAPFLVLPLFARLAVGPIGDAIASAAASVVPPPKAQAFTDEEPTNEPAAPVPRNSERAASHASSTRRPDSPPPPARDAGAPSSGTIVVGASVIAKAIEEKKVGARDALDENGKPFGARIHGVGRYRTGLQNGDVITEVGGVRVDSTKTLIEVGLKQIAAGATKLTGKIVRGDVSYDVILELPPKDSSSP